MAQTSILTLSERGLRPAAQLAMTRPHGDRLRYIAGCRCQECRQSNTAYERKRAEARRAGQWNGLVSTESVQRHLQALSDAGVGHKTVSDICGIPRSTLSAIASGRKTRIRALNAKAILVVTPEGRADHALIPADPTWALIGQLLADGYTKGFLAMQLGNKTASLQLSKKQVTVRNAYDVQRLHERLRKVDAAASWALVADLLEEGYLRSRIEQCIGELAQVRGWEFEQLDLKSNRVRAQVAKLIEIAHRQLTE